MSTVKVTATEVFESLTGYEEVAIAKTFGANPHETDEHGKSDLVGTLLGRSLVFVVARRDGKSDAEAEQVAMSMTVPELLDYFAPEGDEESGKDSESSEPEPESLPPSA